jgi:hypothetical protein
MYGIAYVMHFCCDMLASECTGPTRVDSHSTKTEATFKPYGGLYRAPLHLTRGLCEKLFRERLGRLRIVALLETKMKLVSPDLLIIFAAAAAAIDLGLAFE